MTIVNWKSILKYVSNVKVIYFKFCGFGVSAMSKQVNSKTPKISGSTFAFIVIIFFVLYGAAKGCSNYTPSSSNNVSSSSVTDLQNQNSPISSHGLDVPNDKILEGADTYTWSDGTIYDGEWKSNKINGTGSLIYGNGDKYIGKFVDGKKNGKGIYTWSNGEVYNGEWVNDKLTGSGTYTFKNGDVYNGEWANNKMNGQGSYTFKNKRTFKGTWKDNAYLGKETSPSSLEKKSFTGSTATSSKNPTTVNKSQTEVIANPNNFSLDSSKEVVKKVMGTPTSIISDSSWLYGLSSVSFNSKGTVDSWSDIEGNLKVSIGEKKANSPYFTLGSNKQAVVDTMGTPTSIISDLSWLYGLSSVSFNSKGTVVGWSNIEENLNVSIGTKKVNSPYFTLGSNKQAVVEAMGTPTSIISDLSWLYGLSSVSFNSKGTVVGWSNIEGNLNCK